MKKTEKILFLAVCGLFSAVLLVMSLLNSIQLSTLRQSNRSAESDMAKLETERNILDASLERMLDLKDLEEYARTVLHLQKGEAEIIICHITE